MKKVLMACAAAALVAVVGTRAQAQNLLANPGFELPTTTTTSMGNWFRFGSGAQGFAYDDTTMPRTGTGAVGIELSAANQFGGVFQLLPVPISPGQTVTFTGWHKSAGPDLATHEIKIEWAGAPQNRIDLLNIPTDYTKFTHSAVAPAGTTGATITYALSSFGAGQGGLTTTFIDDFVVTVVPEPATAGMLVVGLAGLMGLRRRK